MRADLIAKLRPYQVEPASRLLQVLKSGGVGFDLSDTGTGKTYVSAAVAADLGVPALVVVPKIAVSAWEAAASHFNDRFSIVGWEMLRTGKTPFGTWENGPPPPREQRIYWQCEHCQVKLAPDFMPACSAHWAGIHSLETKVKPHKYGKFRFNPAVKLVIFDEIHRAAGDSLNAEMVIAARRDRVSALGLTATLANSPLQMRATGFLAGLHSLGDFDRWCGRLGCRRVPMRGMQWLAAQDDQDRIMRELGAQVIPARGIRIRTADIPDFPGRSIISELYDLPEKDTDELNALYALIQTPLDELDAKASMDKDPELGLTKRLRARQKVELLKVSLAEELGQDYLASGRSVVWFVNFQATIDELFKRFPTAGVLDGTVTGEARLHVIQNFQANRNRALIVNNQVGGVALSLQDLQGDAPRVGLVFPCESATSMHQLFGRLARAGGKSDAVYKVLFAARTVEVKMRAALDLKYGHGFALSGEARPDTFKIVEESC